MSDKAKVPDAYDEGPFPDSETNEFLRGLLEQQGEDEGEDNPFAAPLAEEGADAVVERRAALRILDESDEDRRAEDRRKIDIADADEADKADEAEGKPADEPEPPADAAQDEPAPVEEKVEEESPEKAILALLDPYREQLAQHGATPQAAVQRLITLSEYAQTRPDEYVAWFLNESQGGDADKAIALLQKAAERMGLTVTRADSGEADDDDIFKSDRERELEQRLAELEGKAADGKAAQIGPESPEWQAERQAARLQAEVAAWAAETDAKGEPLRPHLAEVQDAISALARQHVARTGKPATLADLDRFYTASAAALSGGATDAAPAVKAVAEKVNTAARAAQKAKRASTPVDGTGQGATRRPEPPESADLETLLARLADERGLR